VLIDPDGRAKVTDFGIARSLEQEGLTAAGRVLGTTDYVSPEQALGHQVTEQSDVYSLGIVLFEMLTGDVPFTGESQVAVAMKHVREPLPDVRALRPEISAALAAVVDRATRKETANRYATVSDMVHDLEEALAIEAARTGRTEGEATTVLRQLPGDTAGFAPLTLRRPRRALALALGTLAAIGAVVAILAARTEEGTRGGAAPRASGQLAAVRLAGVNDYDPPPGDGQEHSHDVREAVDDNRSTYWLTEHYNGGVLNKPGVGLYVEARQPVAAAQLAVITSLPGWTGAVYGANTVAPRLAGWTKLSSDERVGSTERFRLDTRGRRFRYYLVWITSLAAGRDQASIMELTLLAQKR
jgi:serine/threonine-protein kinase